MTQEAKELKHLVKKYKGMLKERQSLTPFKEPIAFLLRPTQGRLDFYENVTGEKFRFTHSGGEERYINLIPTKITNFMYAGDSIRAYILNEDEPFPIPSNPEETADLFRIQNEKTLHDVRKYHAQELRAQALNTKYLLYGIGIITAIIVVYLIARTPTPAPVIVQTPVIPQQQEILGSIIGTLSLWTLKRRD